MKGTIINLKFAETFECSRVTLYMRLYFPPKRQAPRRKKINTKSWMWKVKTQHSRGRELIIASFLP